MRITEQENEDGFTGLYMQDLDDLWYLQNIITPGDHVRMTTLRRVEKKDDMTRSKETARKPVTLTITVESIQFQEFSSNLKILGKIVSFFSTLLRVVILTWSPGVIMFCRYHRSSRSCM